MARIAIRFCSFWVTGLYAARVAAQLRRRLKAEVEMVHGRYGEFKVLVDGQTVIDGGALGMLGVLPSLQTILKEIEGRSGERGAGPADGDTAPQSVTT